MKKIQKYINALAATRARLGLTQEQMGIHMGMSTSKVKLVETNRRDLTSDNILKLAAMEIELAKFKQEKTSRMLTSVKQIEKFAEEAFKLETDYQVSRCTFMAGKLEKKLKRMEFEYVKVMACLYNLEQIESLQLDKKDPRLQFILSARPQLEKRLARCSVQAQTILQKKILMLRTEATVNKSFYPGDIDTYEKPILSQLKQKHMDYTVSMISNRIDCQAMIDMATDDKDALVYRKTGLERQKQSASSTTVGIEADLSATVAEIAALQTVLNGLPEGSVKEDTKVKITKAEYKKFLLEQRKVNYGSLALVEKEYTIACVEQSIAETDAFITALTTRFNELPAA